MRAHATKRKRSSPKNDEHGAALAIAVLRFVRPHFEDEATEIAKVSGHLDLTREDGYDQTVERIEREYCPMGAPDYVAMVQEAKRIHELLLSSNALIRALAVARGAK
jgi:hypothetical protein